MAETLTEFFGWGLFVAVSWIITIIIIDVFTQTGGRK